jgi:GABA permease
MIAFGGAIGAGIFVGSGTTIAQIGPAVVISYLVVGALAAIAMRLLSVQSQHNPDSGAFTTYVGDAFGRVGRFSIGWMYWWLLVGTASVECIAAAKIAHNWLPQMPTWAWSVLFFGTITALNLTRVKVFGEFQFWLVLIKVIMLLAIPVLAVLAVLGVLPGVKSPGMTNIIDNGGLLPFGSGSIFPGILLAAFSFVGIEMAAIASAEADRPRRAVRRSTRIVTYTVAGGYVLALFMAVAMRPWNSPAVAASPFGAMMTAMHIPATESLINVVVFTAVLGVASSCIYAGSRVGFALAQRRDAPKSWGKLSRNHVPTAAVVWTALFALAVTLVGYIAPSGVFNALIDSSGAVLIMVWIAIALSYLKLRPTLDHRPGRRLKVRRGWLSAAATVVSLAMFAMLVGMVFVPTTQLQLLMTAVPVLIIFVVDLWRETGDSVGSG